MALHIPDIAILDVFWKLQWLRRIPFHP